MLLCRKTNIHSDNAIIVNYKRKRSWSVKLYSFILFRKKIFYWKLKKSKPLLIPTLSSYSNYSKNNPVFIYYFSMCLLKYKHGFLTLIRSSFNLLSYNYFNWLTILPKIVFLLILSLKISVWINSTNLNTLLVFNTKLILSLEKINYFKNIRPRLTK